MVKTTEERQKTARTNGSRSRGPTSTRGKSASARNSLKLGIYARILHLPDEDPQKLSALRADWYADIQPQSPAACHLLDECIFADIMSQRTRRAHQSEIAL